MENFQIIEHYNEQRKNEMISFLESKCELPNQLKGNLHVFSLLLLLFLMINDSYYISNISTLSTNDYV